MCLIGLYTFIYNKHYLNFDGSTDRMLMLGSDLEVMSYVTFEIFELSPTFVNAYLSTPLNQVTCFFWTLQTDDQVLLNVINKNNLSNGITFCKRLETEIKVWSFCAEDDRLISFFNENSLSMLTQFINYFEDVILTLELEEEEYCLHFPSKISLSVDL